MSESYIAGFSGLLMVAAVWVLVSVPNLLNALTSRLQGGAKVRSCADCGERLGRRDGSRCRSCRDVRRRRLAEEADDAAKDTQEGDNAS